MGSCMSRYKRCIKCGYMNLCLGIYLWLLKICMRSLGIYVSRREVCEILINILWRSKSHKTLVINVCVSSINRSGFLSV